MKIIGRLINNVKLVAGLIEFRIHADFIIFRDVNNCVGVRVSHKLISLILLIYLFCFYELRRDLMVNNHLITES